MDSVFRLKVPTGRELARVTMMELIRHLQENYSCTYGRILASEWKLDRQSPKDGDLLLLLQEKFDLSFTEAEVGERESLSLSGEELEGLVEAWKLWCSIPVWNRAEMLLGIWAWNWKHPRTIADRFLNLVYEYDLWSFFPALEEHYIED